MERTFDRIAKFDERSLRFPAMALLWGTTKPRSYTWRCDVNLDQGREGACTGFAVTHEAAARPCVVSPVSDDIARSIYHRAKEIDEWPGPAYEGSSVLAAMKAGKERGWYDEYRWAFSEDELAFAVGHLGPAVLGINWYAGMSQPDSKGFVHPTGALQGGHAILCNGYSYKLRVYRLHNSWGADWGVRGDCFISAADLAKLLGERGDACIPVIRKKP
ncbi:MAG TPA: C1 family peptidase [Mesotoga sp.]|nr:C1 family peptidase [Mesotoga sp.]